MKIGVAGSGMIVKYVLNIWTEIDDIQATAIWCHTAGSDAAKTLAQEYGLNKIYDEYDEFLKDDSFDFVYVGLVNSAHYEYSQRALLAGKHVICEKPLTSTGQQARNLLDIAKKKGLFIFESILPWYSENYEEIKRRMGEIGSIKMLQCNFSQYSRRYASYLAGNVLPVFDPFLDGGCLYDINVYNIHWIMGLVGMPKDVEYFPNIGFNGIDTSGVLVLDYDGFKAVCISAKDSASPGRCMVQGDKGCIVMNSEPGRCEKIDLILNNHPAVCIDIAPVADPFTDVYKRIKEMVGNHDYDGCYKMMDSVIDVMSVMEKARKKANIHFSCD